MKASSESYKKTTIVFPLTASGAILGMKKRGFGEGWWNGFGGKLEAGETYEQAAIRETIEEVDINPANLQHVASLHFYFDNVLGVVSKAYITRDFTGEGIETEEMRPQVFALDELPYDAMWPGDNFWIPQALAAKSPLGFVLHFDQDKNFKSIEEVDPALLEDKF